MSSPTTTFRKSSSEPPTLVTHTSEPGVVQALRDGDVAAVRLWTLNTLPEIIPEHLPAPAIQHPLGFACLPLHRSDEHGICLHVWEENGGYTDHIVHAHSWDLWSYVFRGAIFNEIVRVDDEAENPVKRVYEVASGGRKDQIRATERLVKYVRSYVQEIRPGQMYRLPAGMFHRSWHRGLTATIVLGEHQKGLSNLALAGLDGESLTSAPRDLCSSENARKLLRRLSER